jgi:hypothetical protein
VPKTLILRFAVVAALGMFGISGCEEGPPTTAELGAMSAIERVHGQIEKNKAGHATAVILTRAQVGAKVLAAIAALPDLTFVSLEGSDITDAGLESLSGLQRLKRLSLRGTPITDAGLAHLKDLPALEEVDLESTQVTDAGMETLAAISSLRKVYFDRSGPTTAGIDFLKSANPQIRVFRKG